MDNLIIQIRNRARDPAGRIPTRTRYSDKNFVTLQKGIQDRSAEIPRLGIITPPDLTISGLCASGLTIWYSDFECLTPYGVKCVIPAGRVGLCPGGLMPRIDVLAVDPLVQYDADEEIRYSGEVTVVPGLELYEEPSVPHIPGSWLKIGEVGICAGSCISSLRSFIPDKVPTPMAAPRVGECMRLYVNPFRGHIGSVDRIDFGGGFSPIFNPPGISGMHRIDLLTLNENAELQIIQGTEALSPTRPTAPNYPSDEYPIAEVYLQDTDDWIPQDAINDVRPHFTWPVPSGIEWISAYDFARRDPTTPDAPAPDFLNLFPVLKFDDAAMESAYHSLRVPHKYGAGECLIATIDWTNVLAAAETDTVRWGIEYGAVEPCAGISPSLGNRVGICVSPIDCDGQGEAFLRREARVGLSFSGLSAGAILGLRVFRDAEIAEDTLVGDAALLGISLAW